MIAASKYSARFTDGKTSRQRTVYLKIFRQGICIYEDQECLKLVARWPFELMKVNHDWNDKIGGSFEHKQNFGSILDCRSKKTFLRIQKSLKRFDQATYIFSTSNKSLLGLLAATIIFIVIGIPLFTKLMETTAIFVPKSLENHIGEQSIEAMSHEFRPCEDQEAKALLDKLVSELVKYQEDDDLQINIHLFRTKTANAFAVPGEHMAILSGFLAEAKSEQEIAGVLAHEMGHIAHRHSIKYLIQQMGTSFLLSISTGDGAGLAQITNSLSGLSYSRDKELEADRYAKKILEDSGIGTQGVIDFLSRLDGDTPELLKKMNDFTLLSTHPKTQERLELLKIDNPPEVPKSILTKKEFERLKKACQPMKERKDSFPKKQETKKPSPEGEGLKI